MEFRFLSAGFLSRLKIADHVAFTKEIDDRLAAFETENAFLIAARTALHGAVQDEDTVYHSYSVKDFTSDDLAAADAVLDRYMLTIKNMMKALTQLPDAQAANRRVGEIAYQKFDDFGYSTSVGYAAGAQMVINMKQEWTPQQTELTTLGIWPFIVAAAQQAVTVLGLVSTRIEHEAEREKGAMQAAMKETNAKVKALYDVLNSMSVLETSSDLLALINILNAVEDRARQYSISSGSTSVTPDPDEGGDDSGDEGDDPSTDGSGQDEGGGSDVTPVQPENP